MKSNLMHRVVVPPENLRSLEGRDRSASTTPVHLELDFMRIGKEISSGAVDQDVHPTVSLHREGHRSLGALLRSVTVCEAERAT